MTNQQNSGLIDQATVAAMFGVSRRTIHRWVERGLVTVVRDPASGRPFYSREEVAAAAAWVRDRPRLENGQYAPRVTG